VKTFILAIQHLDSVTGKNITCIQGGSPPQLLLQIGSDSCSYFSRLYIFPFQVYQSSSLQFLRNKTEFPENGRTMTHLLSRLPVSR